MSHTTFMFRWSLLALLFSLALALAPLGQVRAQPGDEDAVKQGGSEDDQKLFRDVMDRLLQTSMVRDHYPAEYAWPPKTNIKPNSMKELNAYARAMNDDSFEKSAPGKEKGKAKVKAKIPTEVLITEGFMNTIIKSDSNILAAIMGHEVAHLMKKHCALYGKNDLVFRAFSRDQEIEADLEGVKIAVAASYPYRSGVRAFYRAFQEFGSFSNFEGLTATHPSFIERLEILDKDQKHIWQAMAAFQNGYFFLNAEQYKTAEVCFSCVVKEFPDCAEAWANLGYAKLMQYCDGLDEADLRGYGVGQWVAGCFYSRPSGLEPPRGDELIWKDAVKDLETALLRDPSLILVRANLGLAYLVHPDGKKVDHAIKYFKSAMDQADKGLSGLSLAAFMINYGVAEQAQGKFQAAHVKYEIAKKLIPFVQTRSQLLNQHYLAIMYNEAQMKLAKEETRGKAYADLELYVQIAPQSSTWWVLAFEQYEKLGKDLGRKTVAREVLAKFKEPDRLRVQGSVEIADGKAIVLSDPTEKVLKLLGKMDQKGNPITPTHKKLKRYGNVARGVDLLADNKVLAIFLVNDEAPPVAVQAQGSGAKLLEVRVGMGEVDFKLLMKEYPSEKRYVDRPTYEYLFYPDMGLGVRFQDDAVREMVLAKIPRKWGY